MTRGPFRIFIGWDSREPTAFAVLADSILRHTRTPVAITPLTRAAVDCVYQRPRGATESTEFSLTRFLVPYLCGFEGHALFLDCDMLCQADVAELFAYGLAFPERALHVVQHDYTPKAGAKFLGQAQTVYPRKNWSSVMLFNASRCRALTPAYVNQATGLELHRFAWLANDVDDLGDLPLAWNWLVGEYPPNPDAKLLHYTLGGPWFADRMSGDHADDWLAAFARLTPEHLRRWTQAA